MPVDRVRAYGKQSRIGGYPKRMPDGRLALTDWNGRVLGYGTQKCTRVTPFERGAWISSERCSYRFQVDGKWFAGRGRGEGLSVSLRAMKKAPSQPLRGAARRRRRRR
jgi:hypothetical protein